MNQSIKSYSNIQNNHLDKKNIVIALNNHIIFLLNSSIQDIQSNNIIGKNEKINKTLNIIEQGLLEYLDFENGGEVAQNLKEFYLSCTLSLIEANLKNNIDSINQIKDEFKSLKECWEKI